MTLVDDATDLPKAAEVDDMIKKYRSSTLEKLVDHDGQIMTEIPESVSVKTAPRIDSEKLNMIVQSLLEADEEFWTHSMAMARKSHNSYHRKAFLEAYGCEYGIRWSLALRDFPASLVNKFHYVHANPEFFAEYPEEAQLYVKSKIRVLQSRLKSILKEKRPSSFSPQWIKHNATGVRDTLQTVRRYCPDFSWYDFVDGVGDGWIERFEYRFILEDESTLEGESLKRYQCRKSKYVAGRKRVLQSRLRRTFECKEDSGVASVQSGALSEGVSNIREAIVVLMELDKSVTWADFSEEVVFAISEADKLERALDELSRYIIDNHSQFWSPLVMTELKGANILKRHYGSEYGVRWSLILRDLPKPISDRFRRRHPNQKLFEAYPQERKQYDESRLRYLAFRLKNILDEKRPRKFNVKWIFEEAYGVYKALNDIDKFDSDFSWHSFIGMVGGDWVDSFEPRFVKQDESSLVGGSLQDYLFQKERYIERRKQELQAKLKNLLEEENPDQFSSKWLRSVGQGSLANEISKLIGFSGSLDWVTFVVEMGDEWIHRFDFRCKTLVQTMRKWEITLKRHDIETWSITSLTRDFGSLAVSIRNQLMKKGLTWQDFLDGLSQEVIDKYDYTQDGDDGKRNRTESRRQRKLSLFANRIDELLTKNDLEEWDLELLRKLDSDLYDDIRKLSYGVVRCIPYLSEKALISHKSGNFFVKYAILAERIKRNLSYGSEDGWRLIDINDAEIRSEAEALGDKIELVLKHLPNEIQCAFSRNNRAINMNRVRVGNVLENGEDDTAKVNKILKITRYSQTGEISYRLLSELRAEIARGNRYAVLIADSILEAYLSAANVHMTVKRGNMSELLFHIEDGDDIYMQIVSMAYKLSREFRTISIDAPRGHGDRREWTLHDSVRTATSL